MKNILESTETIAQLKSRIAELETLVKFYEGQFRLNQHRQFGASSEKSEYEQLHLFNEVETTADENVPENEYGVPIVNAPIDEPVIKGSFASPEAIAHIMHQKFVMGTPLYRQEQDWNRQGILLSRQTMSNWLLKATEDWLAPIYDAFREILLTHKVLHADETTLQVLREPGKTAQSKSYMWLYRTSGDAKHPIVLYDYQPDCRAKRPAEFLKGFEGYLHTDGYDAYHKLPMETVVVGCLAHARRKWDEALKTLPESDRDGKNVLRGKRYCDTLFGIERKLLDLSPQERYEKRQELAKPVLDEFYAWLGTLRALPKTPLGKAVHYMFSQRNFLEPVNKKSSPFLKKV